MPLVLPTRYQLVPALRAFQEMCDRETVGPSHPMAFMLESVAYHLRGACSTIQHLELARDVAAQLPRAFPTQQHIISDNELDPIRFAMDAFLFHLRRTFDALVPFLRRFPTHNRNIPSESFSKIGRGLANGQTFNLNPSLITIILDFWTEVGDLVTDYRDRANHTTTIVSNAFGTTRDDGIVLLRLLLPDNPKETSAARLTYSPGVPLMEFCVGALQKTLRFVNELMNQLAESIGLTVRREPKPGPTQFSFVSNFIGRGGPFIIGSGSAPGGEPVPYPLDIFNIVESAQPPLDKSE